MLCLSNSILTVYQLATDNLSCSLLNIAHPLHPLRGDPGSARLVPPARCHAHLLLQRQLRPQPPAGTAQLRLVRHHAPRRLPPAQSQNPSQCRLLLYWPSETRLRSRTHASSALRELYIPRKPQCLFRCVRRAGNYASIRAPFEGLYAEVVKRGLIEELQDKYKIVIEVVDKYGVGNDNYSLVVDTLINQLNQKGYKNTYGYIITLNQEYEEVAEGFAKKVYQVKGDTNAELKFKDPVVVDINSN